MVYHGTISPEIRAYVKFYGESSDFQIKGKPKSVKWLAKKCNISVRAVYRLLKEPLDDKKQHGISRRGIGGRRRKVSSRTESLMMRKIPMLRQWNPNWRTSDLMNAVGIEHVSVRTVQRILNKHGYNFLKARRKGILSAEDTRKRLRYAKVMKGKHPNFWKEDIAFYFDGVGFIHKTRPKENAMACRGQVWRKPGEGLHLGCTSKGQKAGNGGKQAKFFVGISYNRGVICAEQYTELNGESFAQFIRTHFSKIFSRSGKIGKQWIQDGDPSQNSAKARAALHEIGANLLPIPPRSPELNPIENVFSFVKKELRKQVLLNNVEKETYEEFSLRVKATLYSSSTIRINNIIDSVGKRLSRIIIRKGGRIEY